MCCHTYSDLCYCKGILISLNYPLSLCYHVPLQWFTVLLTAASDFWRHTFLILALYFHLSKRALVYGFILSPTHQITQPSVQIQAIMEHYHLVGLAKRCQWPCAAQYPPLISLLPLLKTWNTKSRLLGPCGPSVLQTRLKGVLSCCLHARCPGWQRSMRGVWISE